MMQSESRWGLLALLLACAWPSLADEFVVDDQIVSAPGADIPDPEFDALGKRMVWQDPHGNLWLANMDPVTGAIDPADGRGLLIDQGLYFVQLSTNGPEWVYGNGTAYIA